MTTRFSCWLSGIALVMFASCVTAEQTSSAENVKMLRTLEQLCLKARDAERNDIRRRIVQVCQKKGRSEDQCAQAAKMYGNINIRSVDPLVEIPVCKQASEYRKALESKQ